MRTNLREKELENQYIRFLWVSQIENMHSKDNKQVMRIYIISIRRNNSKSLCIISIFHGEQHTEELPNSGIAIDFFSSNIKNNANERTVKICTNRYEIMCYVVNNILILNKIKKIFRFICNGWKWSRKIYFIYIYRSTYPIAQLELTKWNIFSLRESII